MRLYRLGPFLLAASCAHFDVSLGDAGIPALRAPASITYCTGNAALLLRSPDPDASADFASVPAHPDYSQFLAQVSQNLEGARLLLGRNPNLHMHSDIAPMDAKLSAAGAQEAQEPTNKVAAWLATLEHNLRPGQNAGDIAALKNQFHDRYVIKQEQIPDSYFQNQRRLARERGHGDVMITDRTKSQLVKVLIDDQKQSLDAWIDYFTSADAASYPTWAKAWALDEITTLRAMETGAEHFVRRIESTTGKFPELNREALSMVIDAVTKHAQKQSLDTVHAELKPLVAEARFSKLYAKAIVLTSKSVGGLEETKGTWVRFAKGSDPGPLVQSLDCKNTGWCTAGESTASKQLSLGDFYVYFSNDQFGKPTQPRIAIRMERDSIAEIRGIGKDQHLDSAIAEKDILKEKLKEFGSEGAKYQKKDADMKRLTQVEAQLTSKNPTPLTNEDLRFLYEIDSPIEGFGYNKDPRIAQIHKTRNKKQDLAIVFNTTTDRISLTQEEALKGNIVYHYGKLVLGELTSGESSVLPQYVAGHLFLQNLESPGNLTFPRYVRGNLYLTRLSFGGGIKVPQVWGDVFLRNLLTPEELEFTGPVGGKVHLDSISAVGARKIKTNGHRIRFHTLDGEIEVQN